MKHIGITKTQFNEVWNALPSYLRFFDETCGRRNAGIVCVCADGKHLWVDQFLPQNHIDGEVNRYLERLKGVQYITEDFKDKLRLKLEFMNERWTDMHNYRMAHKDVDGMPPPVEANEREAYAWKKCLEWVLSEAGCK